MYLQAMCLDDQRFFLCTIAQHASNLCTRLVAHTHSFFLLQSRLWLESRSTCKSDPETRTRLADRCTVNNMYLNQYSSSLLARALRDRRLVTLLRSCTANYKKLPSCVNYALQKIDSYWSRIWLSAWHLCFQERCERGFWGHSSDLPSCGNHACQKLTLTDRDKHTTKNCRFAEFFRFQAHPDEQRKSWHCQAPRPSQNFRANSNRSYSNKTIHCNSIAVASIRSQSSHSTVSGTTKQCRELL